MPSPCARFGGRAPLPAASAGGSRRPPAVRLASPVRAAGPASYARSTPLASPPAARSPERARCLPRSRRRSQRHPRARCDSAAGPRRRPVLRPERAASPRGLRRSPPTAARAARRARDQDERPHDGVREPIPSSRNVRSAAAAGTPCRRDLDGGAPGGAATAPAGLARGIRIHASRYAPPSRRCRGHHEASLTATRRSQAPRDAGGHAADPPASRSRRRMRAEVRLAGGHARIIAAGSSRGHIIAPMAAHAIGASTPNEVPPADDRA